MPKRRGTNTTTLKTGRIVNSATVQAPRGQGRLRNNAAVEAALTEPRQIRNVMKQDLKEARAAVVATARDRTKALREFNATSKTDRHKACGSSRGKTAVRFVAPASRDLASNVLPGCYEDPKGLATKNRAGQTKCPCGGSYTTNKSRHLQSKKHQDYASSHSS